VSRTLMSGNEAVARGAWEAGALLAVGYPGTPSTEVLENLTHYDAIRCEWAPNEKVAAEVAAGMSLGGGRSIVTMKHVGLNVAADALYTQSYTGVTGGLVYLVADDPGIHSSQNEQDTRTHAVGAHVPVLEPSDSQEALVFTRRAFELSETYDIPVIVRMTTRISHGKTLVQTDEREEIRLSPYNPDPQKFVMLPTHARARRLDLCERMERLTAESNRCPENRIEMRDSSHGVITSGVAYQYVREALPEASVLKLGMSFPLPDDLIREFATRVAHVAVIEELEPFIAMRVEALGVEVLPLGLPSTGELSPAIIARAFGVENQPLRQGIDGLPPRPPLMCAGCPHRGVFWALGQNKAIVTGDIGCYTLAALPPLSGIDSSLCMGASIGMAHGLSLAGTTEQPVVAVIGDSTFAHSGLTGLLHMAYANRGGTVVVLDNRTTAMTGHQGNPVNGLAIDGSAAPAVDLEILARALGAASVRKVNPHDLKGTSAVIAEEMSIPHLSVIIAEAPCSLLVRERKSPYVVDPDHCTACGLCVKLGCPAIALAEDGAAFIDVTQCVGCSQCVQVCSFNAIVEVPSTCEQGEGS